MENRQIFDTVPTLEELRHFLLVICEEMQEYQVWPVSVETMSASEDTSNEFLRTITGQLLVLLFSSSTASWWSE